MFLRHLVNKSKHYSLEVRNVKILDRNRLVFDKYLKTIIFTRYLRMFFNEVCEHCSAAVW